jgi:hypothetical protein
VERRWSKSGRGDEEGENRNKSRWTRDRYQTRTSSSCFVGLGRFSACLALCFFKSNE